MNINSIMDRQIAACVARAVADMNQQQPPKPSRRKWRCVPFVLALLFAVAAVAAIVFAMPYMAH